MKKLAVIGCGMRGNSYLVNLRGGLGTEWELAAVADPGEVSRSYFLAEYGNPASRQFASGPALIEAMGGELDGLIVTSPNLHHRESFVPAVRLGIPILLEKPVATTTEDCQAMWNAYVAAGRPPVCVGFVLRYTPYGRRMIEACRSGELGTMLGINGVEEMGVSLTALFMRGWRRKTHLAGPLVSEKCSHDMDLLAAMAGARARRIASFGSLRHLGERPGAALHCGTCQFEDTCRYSAKLLKPYYIDRQGTAMPLRRMAAENDLCVYNSDKEIPDSQVIQIEFENDVVATFSIYMDQPRTNRYIKVYGTDGSLHGDLADDLITAEMQGKPGIDDRQLSQHPLSHDNSGHHGGDSRITGEFRSMLHGETTASPTGLREGIEASVIAFAAEEARLTGQVVDVSPRYRQIFGAE